MATRFYTDPTNEPAVSPAFRSWTDTSQAVRRKLVIDTPGNNASTNFYVDETADIYDHILVVQFVSEPLDSITVALSACKHVFRCIESNSKANALSVWKIIKCDSDGSNPVEIDSYNDDVEYDNGDLTARLYGPRNFYSDVTLSQGDRLVFEIGVRFAYDKVSGYNATISVTDNHATDDLPENDTETAAYNSWVETGDTFTVASGDPPWEVVKLGPMFAFAQEDKCQL